MAGAGGWVYPTLDQAEARDGDAGGGGGDGGGRLASFRKSSRKMLRSAQYYSNLLVVPKAARPERARRSIRRSAGTDYQVGAEDEVEGVTLTKELYPRSRDFSVPYFIILVSILELCVFMYHVVNLKNQSCIEIDAQGPVPTCSVLIYNPYRRYEVWRLFTYLAVHGGYVHIASNIIVQLLLGIPLEVVHGPVRVAAVYMAGVVTGALVTSVSDPWAYLAGASGGVYAILAAHAPTLIMNWREMNTILEWVINLLILAVGVVDLSLAIYMRYISDDGDTSVGYAAHLGGAAAGFLVGMNVLRNFETVKWEGYLRLASFLVWSLGVVAAVLVNGLAGEALYPPADFGDRRDCRYYPGCAGGRRRD